MIFLFARSSDNSSSSIHTLHKSPKRSSGCIIGITIPLVALIVLILVSSIAFTRYKFVKMSKEYKRMEEHWIDQGSVEHSTKKWLIEYHDLKLDKLLGSGASGKVFEGRWGKSRVAVKLMRDVASDSQFIEEAHTLIQLRHMNVLLFLGVCIHEDKRYLITELMEGGSLDSILNLKFEVDFSSKLEILRDISEGMIYLHSKKPPIIHRDLKPQNILLDQYMRPKIADFGLSKCGESASGLVGTPQYCAPEILAGHNGYTTSCDIYSFGILMYQVLTESVPYCTYTFWDGIPQLRIIEGERPSLEFLNSDNRDTELVNVSDMSKKRLLRSMINQQKLHKWCKKFGYHNFSAVQRYVELMIECWQGHPMDRPEFIDIHEDLQEILRELN